MNKVIIFFLFVIISCSNQNINHSTKYYDSPIIMIGIKGKHDQLTDAKFLCTGKDDQLVFNKALNIIKRFGGGEITFLPGKYQWYTNEKKTVSIDFNNIHIKGISRSAKILLNSNVDGLIIKGGTEPKNVILEGLNIEVSTLNYSSSILTILANSNFKFVKNVKCNNIGFINHKSFIDKVEGNCNLKVPTPFSAIKMIATNPKKGSYTLNNKFSEIDIDGFENGISLETRGSVYPWINGNTFESIFMDNVVNGVNFHILNTKNKNNWKGYNHNTFSNVKVQTRPFTKMGFKNLTGRGNVLDDCHIWDWQKRCNKRNSYKFLISEDASETYMNIHKAKSKDIKNKGSNTRGLNKAN